MTGKMLKQKSCKVFPEKVSILCNRLLWTAKKIPACTEILDDLAMCICVFYSQMKSKLWGTRVNFEKWFLRKLQALRIVILGLYMGNSGRFFYTENIQHQRKTKLLPFEVLLHSSPEFNYWIVQAACLDS